MLHNFYLSTSVIKKKHDGKILFQDKDNLE